ncbi:MAG: nucleotide sugar dehydrogenase, partial [Candidatus Hydrothermarchaeales archaeon]
MERLEGMIKDRTAVIGVIGLGYVGLPLATIFAKKGFTVIGADIKADVVDKINRGESPINEPGLGELLSDVVGQKRLSATTDGAKAVRAADILFLVVQTPITKDKEPDLSNFKAAWTTVAENLSPGKLLVSESTIPPGTMKDIVAPILEKSRLSAGRDFHLAYSPERAIPTRTLIEMQENGRVVGGFTDTGAELAALAYSQITSGAITKVDIETAEMVKVIENAYRDVNIALANQMAEIAESMDRNGVEVLRLASMHPRVSFLDPGIGVGGHCIPVDPWFLHHAAPELSSLIVAARSINDGRSERTATKIAPRVAAIENPRVVVAGIAYKEDVADTRQSPAIRIVEDLEARGVDVVVYDPLVLGVQADLRDLCSGADLLAIVVGH